MDEELDLVVFEDDQGNQITMEVIDYFFYEGNEYAMLTDYQEDDDTCDACEKADCEGCPEQEEIVIMRVVPVGDDEEEFVPVDEELASRLIEMIESGAFDDDFEEEDDDEQP
ncbi:MAG: DUF1292 domain-containing protein [Clostridia bacterium]|nr:DUF1292 domain-containing protein [Clostridiales bacterium]MDO4828287.1 DUF1292 domain-containing protein [Clostridia bacterium]MDY2769494.1 DUF1292 domain-containing protein [Eubacteriales bacterium]